MLHHHAHSEHFETKFIRINEHRCRACWKCIEACPQKVLGSINVFFHRHVRIDNSELCKGCQKCVKVCPEKAISSKLVVKNSKTESVL
jgi:NAD-dependent dihydropyrimidine dehydrogenase PreA subunit